MKVYGGDNLRNVFEREIKKQSIKSGLRIETVPRGIIAFEKFSGTDAHGVLAGNGRFVKSSIFLCNRSRQYKPKLQGTPPPYFDYDVVYLGYLDNHFGHFLLEGLSRAYPALDEKFQNVKYVYANHRAYDKPAGFVYEFLSMLGISREDVIILDAPAQFRNVFVPRQSFNIPLFSSDEFNGVMDKISAAAMASESAAYDKIYVSRRRLAEKMFGEEKIENVFAKNGYKIIYPETLPLAQQISLVANCKSLAGVAGTALHLAVFMKPGGEVIQIKRNTWDAFVGDAQYLICRGRRLDFTLISGSIERYVTWHTTPIPQIIAITDYMKEFFKERGFKYTKSDFEFDKKSWDEYDSALTEYLDKNPVAQGGKTVRRLIKILSIFVPGRRNRRNFRDWLTRFFNG